MLRKIAWALIIGMALLITFFSLIPSTANAEVLAAPSIEVASLYRLESDTMRISDAPNNLVLFDMLRIDVDPSQGKALEGDLYLPVVPENLEDIILFDGYHVAHFEFTRVSENCVHIFMDPAEVADFDGTVALFLFVAGYEI